VIDLCLSLFDWAKFRQTKGAIKLHLLLDHDGYLPVFATVTEGRQHELAVARSLDFPKGSIVVMDRAFIDYKLFAKWTDQGVYFVTRLKKKADFLAYERRPLPKAGPVRGDQIGMLNAFVAGGWWRRELRVVTIWDQVNQREIQLLTNHLDFAASTIAAIYKDRWQIEIFFKTLKQNLKIKTFVGSSANAVRTQIWTALIALLLIKLLQFRSRFAWAISNLIALLRWNLFTYRDLWLWIDRPFDTPQQSPPKQLEFLDLDSIQPV
jgi:IS4 transposase